MAIQGNDGLLYSFDSKKLMAEVARDLDEFGNIDVYVWVRKVAGIKLYTNFDLPDPSLPLDYTTEVDSGEEIEVINLHDLFFLLKEQNSAV